MTPTEKLARAMGYSTKVDAIGRVQIDVSNSPPVEQWKVFDPRKDGAQGFEVQAWLISKNHTWILPAEVTTVVKPLCMDIRISHDCTGPDLMRAVCDAAERVAEGLQP